jgi:hypothetical protein
MGVVPEWVGFARDDADAVVAMVRAVAEAADPGEYGDGVEVIVEAPPRRGLFGGLTGLFGGHAADQARIVVTKPGGVVRYPFSVQLVTHRGAGAAGRLPRRSGWATSRCDGLAFWMQKGAADDPPDWPALVRGALDALAVLRPDADDAGWRAAVDRDIDRTMWLV